MKLRDPSGTVHAFVNEKHSWAAKCGALFAQFTYVDDQYPTTCQKCEKLDIKEQKG